MSKGAPPGMRVTQKDLMEGTEVDFDVQEEHWNSYELKDGAILKVKLVLNGVKRLQKHNVDGLPIYLIRSANVVRTIDVPEKLKAKPKERTFKPV